MKNFKLLTNFIWYCIKNPDQRFWQALRNWSGYDRIYGESYNEEIDDVCGYDTFYLDDKNHVSLMNRIEKLWNDVKINED